MLLEVSVRNGKICKTLVRSQLEWWAISGYTVQERLCDTGIVQGKVSRMTSPMRQKGDSFATTAKWRLSLGVKKERYSSTNHLWRGLGWNLKGGLQKKKKLCRRLTVQYLKLYRMFVVDSQKHGQPCRRSSVGPDNIHPHHLQPSEPTKQGSGAALLPQNLPGLPPPPSPGLVLSPQRHGV